MIMMPHRENTYQDHLAWMRAKAQELADMDNIAYVIFNRKEACNPNGYDLHSFYLVRSDRLSRWESGKENQLEVITPKL